LLGVRQKGSQPAGARESIEALTSDLVSDEEAIPVQKVASAAAVVEQQDKSPQDLAAENARLRQELAALRASGSEAAPPSAEFALRGSSSAQRSSDSAEQDLEVTSSYFVPGNGLDSASTDWSSADEAALDDEDEIASGTNDASITSGDGFSGSDEIVASGTNEASVQDNKAFGTEEEPWINDVEMNEDEIFPGTNEASTEDGDFALAGAAAPHNFLETDSTADYYDDAYTEDADPSSDFEASGSIAENYDTYEAEAEV